MKSILNGLLDDDTKEMLMKETEKALNKECKIVIKDSIWSYYRGALKCNLEVFYVGIFLGFIIGYYS